ncbi:MAG TPA: hypothetical protein PLH31_00940, partial [Caulobacter sp.]|nr:hypothetical protein [Caulobacter sp.]
GCDLLLIEGKVLAQTDHDAGDILSAFAGAAGAAKIVVMWGGDATEGLQLQEAGADLVVQKPISASDLVDRLKTLFPSHDVGGQGADTDEASHPPPRRNVHPPAIHAEVCAL